MNDKQTMLGVAFRLSSADNDFHGIQEYIMTRDTSANTYISPVYHENLQSIFDHINHLIEIESFKDAKEILLSLHHADLGTFI